ncbi:outer membrane protein transport protein [Mannheimia sp. AT1]|uniref:Outer membrane protein transport protein n=1 Tax=Mannheimia cairinae TaxID=3025936 RepID=A0ABT5MNM4_9PAST|nr:outer membrane protein transport protein [Mannheimia cairinae]MDD0823086.1 outer membrane protein transport protein [Mannheimia cairinae]MDD0825889.1 outer membrane protein transport protein [Mannheimia cairinae]
MNMNKFSKTLLASLVTLTSAGAYSAAFQLAEVSTSGLGMAYAGNAAVADNASVVATNPALMTLFKQTEVSVGGIFVDADINIEGKLNSTGSDASHKNIVPNAIIPNLYVVSPINDRFSIGGGVNVNYGLKSEFSPNYSAGFFGGRTDLSAVNVNLSGAYNLGYGFSIGAGINAVHAKAELERYLGAIAARFSEAKQALANNQDLIDNAIQNLKNLETAIAAGNTSLETQKTALLTQVNGLLQANGLSQTITTSNQLQLLVNGIASINTDTTIHKLKGDKWGFGWNAGLLYEINENNRLGISYHSAINLKFKGKYSNTVAVAIPNVVNTTTGGAEIDGSLTLRLPAYWEVSGYHKLTEKLAAQYSYKRTNWSSFKSLDAYGQNDNLLFHKVENFNDSQRIAFGLSYDLNEMLTLRTGIAYDESASVRNPSISIPDTDRTWYSLGATVRATPNLSVDIGYSHLRGSKLTFNEDNLATFKSRARANLYGLNVNYKF